MRTLPIPPPTRTLRVLLALLVASLVAFAAAQSSEPSDDYAPDVSYTLTTGLADGKMAFIGSSGPIDGVVNPELTAEPGDLVQITLVNGDGVVHDLKVGGHAGGQTDEVTEKGASSVIAFRAEEAGSFDYWCTIPGHRAAGMEGSFTVGEAAAEQEALDSIVRLPTDVPEPIGDRDEPVTHDVTLTTTEKVARLADGTSYRFWTFNDRVPGPLLRVRVGDTVNVTLENPADSRMSHSVDFHAATGPGGGAVATQTPPGESTHVSFKALQPGLFVYHCATPMVAHHITNGMYGLILVEPEGGLSEVDREFYVMQGELYTAQDFGTHGDAEFSVDKLLDEDPEYFVFNGAVGALSQEAPLTAEVGETVRIFFGVGGPNATSSFHVIGEIFERVYDQASLTSPPLTDVQTTTVAPGGATMVEFGVEVPGDYVLVDHALSRAERGLVGILQVSGEEDPTIFDPGRASGGAGH
jgi:nitrite reductase (NO-forming)